MSRLTHIRFTGPRWLDIALILPLAGLLAACGSSKMAEPPQFAELVPVAMMQAALPPAPPPAPVESAKMEPPPPSGPKFGGHLASYYREADALKGWNIIVGQQSSIGSLSRHIVPIQTPKGPMVRLIAGDFPNADEATRFCTWARQQHLYCAVMALGPDATTAMPASMQPSTRPPTPLTRPARRPRPRG